LGRLLDSVAMAARHGKQIAEEQDQLAFVRQARDLSRVITTSA
jgi:hypothetical protein